MSRFEEIDKAIREKLRQHFEEGKETGNDFHQLAADRGRMMMPEIKRPSRQSQRARPLR
jgi:hypothetical protein